MESENLVMPEKFVRDYLKSYSKRDLSVISLYDKDFMGLDGISVKIYDRESWIDALKHDYKEIPVPFKITIFDCNVQEIKHGYTLVTVISYWHIPIFENAPEFDKLRTVFLLALDNDTFKIVHLSNSLSLLPLNNHDVYPTELVKFLKHFKEGTFGNLKNQEEE